MFWSKAKVPAVSKLSRYDSTTLDKKTIELLPYGGSRTSVWALNCYASVDGMAVSADSVLCIGTTIDQSQYDNVTSDTPHNIYLTITPVSDFSKEATSVKYLTNYTGNGKSFMGVKDHSNHRKPFHDFLGRI